MPRRAFSEISLTLGNERYEQNATLWRCNRIGATATWSARKVDDVPIRG